MKDTTLTYILLAITTALLFLYTIKSCNYQNLKRENIELKQIIDEEDSTTTTSTDTLYLQTIVKDTIPQTITQTIYKTDTLYKVENDTVKAKPIIVTLKKKKCPTQL